MPSAEIAGTLSATVIEDETFDRYGTVYVSGDAGNGSFFAGTFDGLYGTLTLSDSGDWHYKLDDSLPNVQSLALNSESHDYFVVTWGAGFLQSVIDILVRGANDPASFGGDLFKTLDVRVADSVIGQIEINDSDVGEKEVQPVSAVLGNVGTLTVSTDGNWRYVLLPGQRTAILDDNKSFTDAFQVASKDGTLTQIVIRVSPTPDVVTGTSGNDVIISSASSESIDGFAGIDTVTFHGYRASYTIMKTSTGYTVKDLSGTDGTDSLSNIERIQFSDRKLALDVDSMGSHAELVARILGAVFGKDSLANMSYVGIGLNLLDGGMSYQDLMQLALNVKLGNGFSTASEITLLYQNLLGIQPSASDLTLWTNTVSSGQITQASLAVLAADTALNATNINLVGLTQTGIEYT